MLPSKWPIDAGMNILEEMPMEPASYFNMLLADPRITMLQILGMQRPLEVARVYVPLRISEERQQGYNGHHPECCVKQRL